MKIIAFTGMPFSGKSEAVQIAKTHNIPVVRMGDLVWEETQRKGRPLDDKNVGDVANTLRKQKGMNVWAKRTVQKIKTIKPSTLLVIDGIRNTEEIDYFKKTLGNDFVVIAVTASDEVRWKRALSRGRTDDSKTLKDVKERDMREMRWGLPKVIAEADIVIENDASLDELQHQVTKILNHLAKAIS